MVIKKSVGRTLLNPTFRPWLAYKMDKTTAPYHEVYRGTNFVGCYMQQMQVLSFDYLHLVSDGQV